MGCPQEVYFTENLIFSIRTHDSMTGDLTDTTGNPTYRIYANENGTPILTGSMSKLDDAGTVGFYAEQIACTAINGFSASGDYTIAIDAKVGDYTGGISYDFKVKQREIDEASEGVYSAREMLRLMAAVLAGKVSGGGTSSIVFRDLSDSADRVTATVDSSGNRLAVTLNAS